MHKKWMSVRDSEALGLRMELGVSGLVDGSWLDIPNVYRKFIAS